MFKKAIFALSLLFVMLLAVSSVSAADNMTENIVSIDNESSAHLKIDDGDKESSLTQNTIDLEELEYNNESDNTDSSDVISISADNPIISDDFNSNYEDLYLSNVDTYYNADYTDAYMEWCWDGYFEGKLVIYHGQSIVFSKNIKGDRIGSPDYDDCWMLVDNAGKPVPVGSYNAKLFSKQGKVLKTASIKIAKAPTDLFVDSKTTKAGNEVTIKSYIEDDCGRAEYAKGKITLKINGKTYSANVKNGKFSISFKAPSKAKKYTGKLIYSGDSNYKSSSVKFKLTVKKSSTIKKTSTIKKKPKTKKTTTTKKEVKFTVMVPVNFNKKISRTHGNYKVQTYKYCANDYWLSIKIYKNGKILKKFKAKYHIYVANGKGVSVTVDNNKWHKTVSARTIINAYKVKATVWV